MTPVHQFILVLLGPVQPPPGAGEVAALSLRAQEEVDGATDLILNVLRTLLLQITRDAEKRQEDGGEAVGGPEVFALVPGVHERRPRRGQRTGVVLADLEHRVADLVEIAEGNQEIGVNNVEEVFAEEEGAEDEAGAAVQELFAT